MDDSSNQTLGFAATSRGEWRRRVEGELGDRAFDHALVSELPGVGRIEPLYTREDLAAAADPSARPGLPPFLRGGRLGGGRWTIAPLYRRGDPADVASELLNDLRGGAGGAVLRFDRAGRTGDLRVETLGYDGVAIHRLDDLRRALEGVHLEMISLRLAPGANFLPAAALVFALVEERGLPAAELDLSLGADPLGALAAEGSLPRSLEDTRRELGRLAVAVVERAPKACSAVVSTEVYHDAGAGPALELACAIATVTEYLRWLTDAGLSSATAAGQIDLFVPVGCDVFVEIAKLRALRGMWSRVVEVCGAGAVTPRLHAGSSERSLSTRGPWVNALRVTAQALAAAVGGAESITTLEFDGASGEPSSAARRLSRNTQLILAEESRLGAVADPAGGSYFVESLTRQLAADAWRIFQQIEAAGGLSHELVAGGIAIRIEEAWAERRRRLAERRLPLTGVSAFPRADEAPALASLGRPPEVASGRLQELEPGSAPDGAGSLPELIEWATGGATIFELSRALEGAATALRAPALPRRRDAELFERLHARGHALPSERRKVFLAHLGPLAEFKPRSSFAREAVAVAGLEAVPGDGTADLDPSAAARELARQLEASGAALACLCGSDERYETHGVAAASALRRAGRDPLLCSGRPAKVAEALRDAGVAHFFRAGGDLHALLSALLDAVGEAAEVEEHA